jgi:hypothetical protein
MIVIATVSSISNGIRAGHGIDLAAIPTIPVVTGTIMTIV